MPEPTDATYLVRLGWRELQLQRPLAAWGAWQRALQVDPQNQAAREALDLLAQSPELPESARQVRRFRPPTGEERRYRWDEALGGRDLSDLDEAASVFLQLAEIDPVDAEARYNAGLALAWAGRNREAIAVLNESVRLDGSANASELASERAVESWALAEILRQGAGAESIADEVSESLTLVGPAADFDPTELAGAGLVRPMPSPPGAPADYRGYEWLDRPFPDPELADRLTADGLPRLLAVILKVDGRLRFTTPVRGGGLEIQDGLDAEPSVETEEADAETRPRPIALMDADLWTFRLPSGLPESDRRHLVRESIEQFYEDRWIHDRRHGLDGLSPLAASRRFATEPALRAKLAAVIRVREELAARPAAIPLMVGYPFDRLRRRLGLETLHPSTIDADDPASMGLDGLSRLDPDGLAAPLRSEAARSARALGREGVALARRFEAPGAPEP